MYILCHILNLYSILAVSIEVPPLLSPTPLSRPTSVCERNMKRQKPRSKNQNNSITSLWGRLLLPGTEFRAGGWAGSGPRTRMPTDLPHCRSAKDGAHAQYGGLAGRWSCGRP